jgi:hypothetical protein
MKTKYSALLRDMVGYTVKVTEEQGLCHIVATGNSTLSATMGLLGVMTMEIKEVHDDFIVLTSGILVRMYSIHVVVLDLIPS